MSFSKQIAEMMLGLRRSQRPILIFGAGVRNGGNLAREVSKMLSVPVAPTWGALDLFPGEMSVGSFGTHGNRAGNFAVQNADWILSVGSRLDSKATGTPIEAFAREANIWMVDIDQCEIDKFHGRVEGICSDARYFLGELKSSVKTVLDQDAYLPSFDSWKARIRQWKDRYIPKGECPPNEIDPYELIEHLSLLAQPNDVIVTDTGCAVAWVAQKWNWKEGQRFIHAFNQTPMGYGLPAAIGACFAGAKRVILVTGDGSIMMSIGELATVARHRLPIHIVLLNNLGHGMCRQTQREWMGGTYPATSIEGGLSMPDFVAVAKAFKLRSLRGFPGNCMREMAEQLVDDRPTLLEAMVYPDAEVLPKVKFGKPNEDGYPYLPREEFLQQMIVPPYGDNLNA